MNSRKAKAIKKIVYQGMETERKYMRLKSTGQVINTGDIEQVDDGTGKLRKIPRRKIYQHLKKISRGVPIKLLQRTFLNENTKAS